MIPPNQILLWINALGLILSRLPEAFWIIIFDKIIEVLTAPVFLEWDYNASPFIMFNYELCSKTMLDKSAVNVLAIAQSIFHHFSFGQIAMINE